MSTILESLRQAARARAGGQSGPGDDPDLQDFAPENDEHEEPDARRPAAATALRPWLAPALALAALLAAAGYAWRPGTPTAVRPTPAADAAVRAALPPSAPGAMPAAMRDSMHAAVSTPVSAASPPEPAVQRTQARPPAPSPATKAAGPSDAPAAAKPAASPAPRPLPGPTPRPGRPPSRDTLPLALRSALPPLSLGARIAGRPGTPQVLLVDGRAYHEGQALAPGLVLERVAQDHAVFSIRERRFAVDLPGGG